MQSNESFPEPQKKPEKSKNYKQKVLDGDIKPWNTSARPAPGPRKTPMTSLRSSRGDAKKRKPLKPMSPKMTERMKKYRKLLKEFWAKEENSRCRKCGAHGDLDPHHTHGRGGENLFTIIPLCRKCHDGVHANPNKARQEGWLFF